METNKLIYSNTKGCNVTLAVDKIALYAYFVPNHILRTHNNEKLHNINDHQKVNNAKPSTIRMTQQETHTPLP